ncbi:hypothetical protein GP486_001329 [Trichoglossum hirsutum]|uniref:Uncharacterized protein n=1 Tax=Trichoglossum hirsutum TaxID=265104 RepID=A0A9P8LHC6_9PEZI|nr:hypothetical protein GP486_001329 [Trichoglossum hirsutum]
MGQSFREIAKFLGLVQGDQEVQDAAAARNTENNDLELLRHVWPANGQGPILLTTRDANAPYSLTSAGFHVCPFDGTTGSEVLLNLTGLDSKCPTNQVKAKAIMKTLGGLPLALTQIDNNEYTLSIVWETSIKRLSGEPYTLLNLCLFQPDAIDELVLIEGSKRLDDIEPGYFSRMKWHELRHAFRDYKQLSGKPSLGDADGGDPNRIKPD